MKRRNKTRSNAIKYGYRSGLELTLANQIKEAGLDVAYEATTLGFIEPEKKRKYTPDFILPNGIVIESKGRFMTADRKKHMLLQSQYPDMDLRFVFTNSKAKIYKGSDTTYADWCMKHGFLFADKLIPSYWFEEELVNTNSKEEDVCLTKN